VRVLHLIDPGSPGGGGCTLQLLAEAVASPVAPEGDAIEHDVIVVGTRCHERAAQRCGVGVAGRVARRGWRALRRAVGAREDAGGVYDVVHGWTLEAGRLATVALPHRPRLTTLTVGPVADLATRLRLLWLGRHPMPLLVASPGVADECRTLGVPPSLLHELPPGIDSVGVAGESRQALRQRWGVDDGDFVVGLLSQPITWGDARQAINIVSRGAATRRPMKLVLHPRAARRVEAERWARRVHFREIMIAEDAVAEPWRVRHGLDAALFIGGERNTMDMRKAGGSLGLVYGGGWRLRPVPGILPLLWAMSAGVPVVAEASRVVTEIAEHGRHAMLIDHFDINPATARLIELHDDASLGVRIGQGARARVRERFHVEPFRARLHAAWEQVARGDRVALPDVAPPPGELRLAQ
jgi:hypothetical protein